MRSIPPLRRKRDGKAAKLTPIDDDAAAHWHEAVIPELINEARMFEIILSGEPSLSRAIDLWQRQRNGLELAVAGEANPARRAKIISALRERDKAMERIREKARAHMGQRKCQ
jgi:hypothetical protein